MIGAACAFQLLAACQARPASVSEAPADQAVILSQADQAIPTALPLQTFIAPTEAPQAQPHVAAPLSTEGPVEAEVPADPSVETGPTTLLDLAPGDQLKLLAEIAVPRSDFGVRLAFSPSDHMLLHSGSGLMIQRFDLLNGLAAPDLTGFENMSPLSISVSPDGSQVVADDGAQVWVWNSQSGQIVNALPLPPISTVANAGYIQDQLFYVVDYHGNVLVWDPHNWGRVAQFQYPGLVDTAMLFPNGEAIAIQDHADRTKIAVYGLDGNKQQVIHVAGEDPRLLSVSPSGDRFLLHVNYGLPSEGVEVVSASTGETLLDLGLLNYREFAVSSDWQLLAAAGVADELRLYSLPSSELLLSQPLDLSQTISLSFSPNAAYLALFGTNANGNGGDIQVWGPEQSG